MLKDIEGLLPPGMPFVRATERDAEMMDLALYIRGWSKHGGRKFGSVIEREGRFVSLGFNGFPRGVDDTDPELLADPIDIEITVCAERNAIKNAEMAGVSLEGTTAHVPWFPCRKCAPAIIQTGQIKAVVVVATPQDVSRIGPAAKWGLADYLDMLHNAGIAIRWHDPLHEKYHGVMERKPHTPPIPSGMTDWDKRFLNLAKFYGGSDAIGEVIAKTSHPPAVRDDKIVRALGRWRPDAESEDALANARRNGVSLHGMTLYCSAPPSSHRLMEIFEAGITCLVLPENKLNRIWHRELAPVCERYGASLRWISPAATRGYQHIGPNPPSEFSASSLTF